MAGPAGLTAARRRRPLAALAALTLVVGLAHWAGLAWLASMWREPAVLRPLATPVYTRVIEPVPPPQVAIAPSSPSKPPVVPTNRSSIATNSIANSPTGQEVPAAPDAPASASAEAAATAASASSPAAPAPEPVASAASAPAVTAPPPLDSWPADTRLSYRLGGQFRGDLHGQARVQWQRQDQAYQTRVDIDIGWLASLSLISQGDVTPGGLRPKAYEESIRGRRRGLTLDATTITLASGARVPRPATVQDTASQFVELAHRFATGQQALKAGGTVDIWLARPGGVDLWTYDVVGEETLQTPGFGPLPAFHLKPRPIAQPRGSTVAELWFAPSLQHLPVRIRIQLGDAVFIDLLIDRIEQR